MSRPRSIKIAALNIAMHSPHSPMRYVELFKDAVALQKVVHFGTHGSMLGPIYFEDPTDPLKGFTGEIRRFVILNPNEPWFNAQTKDIASDDDMENIKIPDHMRPQLQRIPFVFKPDVHELWFINKDRNLTLGPQPAVNFFKRLMDEVCVIKGYPAVEVTALPDFENLESLLSIPKLEKLTIELKRPNADDAASDETRFLQKLEKQNAQKMKVEFVAEKGESILPDVETRQLATVAARNGKVSVVGRNETGAKVVDSTEHHPLIETILHDPEVETIMDVLKRLAGFG